MEQAAEKVHVLMPERLIKAKPCSQHSLGRLGNSASQHCIHGITRCNPRSRNTSVAISQSIKGANASRVTCTAAVHDFAPSARLLQTGSFSRPLPSNSGSPVQAGSRPLVSPAKRECRQHLRLPWFPPGQDHADGLSRGCDQSAARCLRVRGCPETAADGGFARLQMLPLASLQLSRGEISGWIGIGAPPIEHHGLKRPFPELSVNRGDSTPSSFSARQSERSRWIWACQVSAIKRSAGTLVR